MGVSFEHLLEFIEKAVLQLEEEPVQPDAANLANEGAAILEAAGFQR